MTTAAKKKNLVRNIVFFYGMFGEIEVGTRNSAGDIGSARALNNPEWLHLLLPKVGLARRYDGSSVKAEFVDSKNPLLDKRYRRTYHNYNWLLAVGVQGGAVLTNPSTGQGSRVHFCTPWRIKLGLQVGTVRWIRVKK